MRETREEEREEGLPGKEDGESKSMHGLTMTNELVLQTSPGKGARGSEEKKEKLRGKGKKPATS